MSTAPCHLVSSDEEVAHALIDVSVNKTVVRDYDINLELNELCSNFGEASSFPGGGTARRCDQLVLTILYVPFLCPMIKAMPS